MANPKMWSTGEGNDEEEVANHPYLGVKKGQREVGKYLPTTRRESEDWASVVPEPELSRLRAAGYFVDLWQWRVNRTNPVGKTDDGLVAEARYADPGKSVFFGSNWSAKDEQPKMMFDPAKTGHRALTWKEVADGHIAAADLYVREDQALPFDPKQPWKDGDTIPARLMHPGEGSADDLAVAGRPQWSEGHWDVTLRRAMNTGHPQDDKAMLDKGVYTLAFGIHHSSEGGSRFHYVSLPVSLGLDRDAQVNAVQVAEGKAPTWDQEWTSVTLFYPGRVAWSTLASKRHAGSKFIERGVPVKFRHSEKQLAHYGLEAMFADEVWRQWMKTMFAGIALIAAFGFTLHRLLASDAKRT
jgi:hypothetical protein